MESPRKFNDCYFYYYSTCTKGDNCVFRHEPSALGCETMCTAWQQGKCLDKRCKLRHMELRKNRKHIPCYWENQPCGCRKMHCPFMHKNPEARTDGIAPSQPGPPQPAGLPHAVSVNDGVAEPPMGVALPVPAPAATPVPLLWQQQRSVVLDSAILGVLPASGDILGARRVIPPHPHAHAHSFDAHAPHAPHAPHGPHVPHAAHAPHAPHAAHAPGPYTQMPVDPLVVNFEEESDNESGPSSTPTKESPEELRGARSKSQELLLLERIQAEAAAYYRYDAGSEPPSERRLVRSNLSTKYDRLSLDEIAGKKQLPPAERRKSLDFKILSLDEIRARKKTDSVLIHHTPITLNLSSRKRTLSTQETITTSGNKIIKVVRSNSIVYKKVDQSAPTVSSQPKVDHKQNEENLNRKRTLSEMSDLYEIQDDELVDNCHEFKRIKFNEQTTKPRLIRNRSLNKDSAEADTCKDDEAENRNKVENDSDSEVQIVSVGISEKNTDVSAILDTEIIDVDSTRMGDPVAIVDLSDDDSDDVTVSDLDLSLVKSVPDVVASCQKNTNLIDSGKDLLSSIDAILNDEL